MQRIDLDGKTAFMPPVIGWPVQEEALFGSKRFVLDRTQMNENGVAPYTPVVIFDGRRFEKGREIDGGIFNDTRVGVQQPYTRFLPNGTIGGVVYTGQEANRKESRQALREHLDQLAEQGQIVAVVFQGGQHISHETIGAPPPNPVQRDKYGKVDPHRDDVNLEQAKLAKRYPEVGVVANCRGMQVVVYEMSEGLAIPQDHGQDHHHGLVDPPINTIFRSHPVRDMLPSDVRASMRIQPPRIRMVNSAHSQGFLMRDLEGAPLDALAKNGWIPWLRADVRGVDEGDQTLEALIRVLPDGSVTGAAKQYHDERSGAPYGRSGRSFSQQIIAARSFALRA